MLWIHRIPKAAIIWLQLNLLRCAELCSGNVPYGLHVGVPAQLPTITESLMPRRQKTVGVAVVSKTIKE